VKEPDISDLRASQLCFVVVADGVDSYVGVMFVRVD
jgi:hypothetical protein